MTVDLYNIGERIRFSGPLITDSPSLEPIETITGVGEAKFLSGVASLEVWRPFIRIQEDSSCLYRYDFKANAFPQRPQTWGLVLE